MLHNVFIDHNPAKSRHGGTKWGIADALLASFVVILDSKFMLGTTHQMVALLSALWLLTIFPISVSPGLAVGMLVAVMVGALTPDLDQPTANIWRRVIGARALGNIFQWFSGGHRHMTHSLIGIVLIGYFTHWVATDLINEVYRQSALLLWRAYMIGYISHPIADSVTDLGVPWLWPLHMNFKFPPGPEEVRVTTGSFVELILVRGAILISGMLIVTQYWATIRSFFSL